MSYASNPPTFERYSRSTLPEMLLNNPDLLFDQTAHASLAALGLSYHYGGDLVGAAMPVIDDGTWVEPTMSALKMLTAGSFKPYLEETPEEKYVRVCAEQNLLDNAASPNDTHLGFMAIRGPLRAKAFEGTSFETLTKAFRLCGPCRGRCGTYLTGSIAVVGYRGDSMEPIDVTTIDQQQFEEDGLDVEPMARGKEVKEYIVDKVLKDESKMYKIERLPRLPQRIHQRTHWLPAR